VARGCHLATHGTHPLLVGESKVTVGSWRPNIRQTVGIVWCRWSLSLETRPDVFGEGPVTGSAWAPVPTSVRGASRRNRLVSGSGFSLNALADWCSLLGWPAVCGWRVQSAGRSVERADQGPELGQESGQLPGDAHLVGAGPHGDLFLRHAEEEA